MAIYTKTGDQGQTGLRGAGKRISKSTLQVSVLGSLDELNSQIGLAIAMLNSFQQVWLTDEMKKQEVETLRTMIGELQSVQGELLHAGAVVAQVLRPPTLEDMEKAPPLDQRFESSVLSLEKSIDGFESLLPPLRHFILPGGSVPGAQLLVTRAVCRRAERELVRWMEYLTGDRRRNRGGEIAMAFPLLLAYVNRLSDWLFVAGRLVNQMAGEDEVIWQG